jgi:capsular exopolysaccharide synthesis family protein
MSHIFDALQRSEAENSGVEVKGLFEATELLERAERRASSRCEVETAVHKRGTPATLLRPEVRFEADEATSTVTLEMPEDSELESRDDLQGPFDRFRSMLVPDAAKNRILCLTDTDSAAAEAFRLLGVRLRHLRRERTLARILITSTIPQEGKSTVAANLACTLSTRQKTLLLEGDIRRPSLSQVFGLNGKPGLSNCLRGEAEVEKCIYHLEGPGFWILPAGNYSGNPLELLQSNRLSALMDQLAGWFHWMIIDSPPVLPLADASVWARLSDGILLVTRRGTTEKRQLQRGIEALEPQKLIGALLNSSESASGNNYYYSNTDQQPVDTSTH